MTTAREESTAGEEQNPFAHLMATPDARTRVLATARPFDADAWLREAVPATPDEVADLEEFLREREAMRRYSLERQEERLEELER